MGSDVATRGARESLPEQPLEPTAKGLAAQAKAREYARRSMSPATLRAYRSDWQHFSAWCAEAGLAPIPAVRRPPESLGGRSAQAGP